MATAPDAILKTVLQELTKVPAQERAEVFSTVMVELLNAGGVPMDGETAQSSLRRSPSVVGEIAMTLGKKATLTRNKYSIYPFARPSICASGPVYYIDAKTGELFLLLNRRIKDSYQWLYAAGYMELLPPNIELLSQERVSEAQRNSEEEGTMGVHFSAAESSDVVDKIIDKVALPRQRPLRQLIYDEFKRLSAVERWDVVVTRLGDPEYLRDLFKRYAIEWPANLDISSKNTFIRETREETGLNLLDYPSTVIQLARSLDASVSSGGARLYNVDQLFFGYMGVLQEPPPLAAVTTEAVEAAWIAASEIYYAPERNQYVVKKDSRPLHFNAMQGIEYTMLGLLNYLIEQVSQVTKPRSQERVSLFSDPASVQAALVAHAKGTHAAINELVDHKIGTDKTLPSLMHHSGQAMFRSFVAAARGTTEGKKPEVLQELILKAQKNPSCLPELLAR